MLKLSKGKNEIFRIQIVSVEFSSAQNLSSAKKEFSAKLRFLAENENENESELSVDLSLFLMV